MDVGGLTGATGGRVTPSPAPGLLLRNGDASERAAVGLAVIDLCDVAPIRAGADDFVAETVLAAFSAAARAASNNCRVQAEQTVAPAEFACPQAGQRLGALATPFASR